MNWKGKEDKHSWEEKYYKVEEHPYPDHIPDQAVFLIIGSFPSHQKNANFKFFYGGKGNRFWPLLSKVFEDDFLYQDGEEAVLERKALLDKHRIGITDMITKCYRYQARSGDENLYPIRLKAILQLLDEHKSIKRIIFTGRLHIIGPLGLFRTYLHQHDKVLGKMRTSALDNLEGEYHHNGRLIEIMVPYSPSKRFSEDERLNFAYLLERYQKCFENNFNN